MCTIGSVLHTKKEDSKISGNVRTVFKQCDLNDNATFLEPQIFPGSYKFMPFLRSNSNGPWAGVNEWGVSFVAADSYINPETGEIQTVEEKEADIFSKYNGIIARHKTAKEATAMMVEFYTREFKEADILMIADYDNVFFIEAFAGKVQVIERPTGFFASTNHFRMIYGAVPYRHNHSTYLRLQRAESILQTNPDISGVRQLLSDRYYGDTVWSICRTAKETPAEESAFYTQASVIFNIGKSAAGQVIVDVQYIINGNPAVKEWKHLYNVFKK